MFISKIDNILPQERLARVQKTIETAKFVDGRISGGSERNKKNLEVSPETEKYIEMLNIVELAVRENLEFNLTAFPRRMTRPIFSRYGVGMYYRSHVDNPVMGFMSMNYDMRPVGENYVRSDLSMTLFLNDPDSYDGGELTFEGSVEPIRVKLKAGSAILYPTGSRHSVAPVTRGVRHAAIFWIQTMFPVEAHRQAVYDARRLMNMVENLAPDSELFNFAQDNFFNLGRILAQL
jgi:PKHD-type hydroxylase